MNTNNDHDQTIHIHLKPELTSDERNQRDCLHTYVSTVEPYRKANNLNIGWLRKRLVEFKPTVADCKNHLHGYIDHLVSLSEEELSEWANSEHNVPKDEV